MTSGPVLSLQPEDLFQVRNAHSPAISPDGRYVLYAIGAADPVRDTTGDSLWLLTLAGGTHRRIADSVAGQAVWSPDSARIAWADGQRILLWTVADGGVAELPSLPQAPSRLAWSPDGGAIAFLLPVPDAPYEIPGMPSGAAWATPPFVTDRLVSR